MSEEEQHPELTEPRIVAAVDLLRRLGANTIEFRYSEPEKEHDNSPVIWMTIAEFDRYSAPHQVAAGLDPVTASERLLEQLIDGGECQHCLRPTMYFSEPSEEFGPPSFCAYTYDPETNKYRRSCEGDN